MKLTAVDEWNCKVIDIIVFLLLIFQYIMQCNQSQYVPFIGNFFSKCLLLKAICQIFDDVLLNEDIATFSLESLSRKLNSVDSSYPEMLAKSSEFLLEQVTFNLKLRTAIARNQNIQNRETA